MKPLKQRTACPIPAGAGVLPKRRTAGAISFARVILVAGLLTVAATATAQASGVKYVITENAGLVATDLGSGNTVPVSLTGQFTYETSPLVGISDFNVTLTTEAPFNGTYTFDNNPQVIDLSLSFSKIDPVPGYLFLISLSLNDFGGVGQYFIQGGHVSSDDGPTFDLLPADPNNLPYLTGTLQVGEPAVPEPSTWAMVLGAFAGAAAWARAHRRAVAGPPPVVGNEA